MAKLTNQEIIDSLKEMSIVEVFDLVNPIHHRFRPYGC